MEACTIDINEKRKGFAPSSFVLKKKGILGLPWSKTFSCGEGKPIFWEEALCSLEGVLMNFCLWVLTSGEEQNANSATEKCKWDTCLLSRAYPTKCLEGCCFEGDAWSVGTPPSQLSDSSCPLDHSGDEILTVASENLCFWYRPAIFYMRPEGVSGSSSFPSVCSNWAHSSVHGVYFQLLSPKRWEPGRSCCPAVVIQAFCPQVVLSSM